MKKIYIGGTFDLYHTGHINLFKKAKDIADYVIVALNTDGFNEKYKGKRPIMSLEERTALIMSCRYVDEVIINTGGQDSKPAILKAKPDYILHGSDWGGTSLMEQMGLTEQFLKDNKIEMKNVPYTTGVSTTELLDRIRQGPKLIAVDMDKTKCKKCKMFKTDKYKTGLIDIYNKEFKYLKDSPVTFLELGIYNGGSLFFWNDYFKNAKKIIGYDLIVPDIELPDNVLMIKGNQSDYNFLMKIGNDHGKFDIILDDCSHQYGLTTLSFNALFPFVKPGGLFIIEDWTAGFSVKRVWVGLQNILSDIIRDKSIRFSEMKIIKTADGGSTAIIKKV